MVEGAVIHYVGSGQIARANHAECDTQVAGIVAYHERNGYRQGGAYNVHRCQHGGRWLHYLGPNQATGDTWANLHLHAICAVIGDGDEPSPILLASLAEEIDMIPGARQSVTPHSNWFNTSCCGDPLRAWIAAGALAPFSTPPEPEVPDMAGTIYHAKAGGFHYFDGLSSRFFGESEPDVSQVIRLRDVNRVPIIEDVSNDDIELIYARLNGSAGSVVGGLTVKEVAEAVQAGVTAAQRR